MTKSKLPAHKVGKYLARQQNCRRRNQQCKAVSKMPFCIVSVKVYGKPQQIHDVDSGCWLLSPSLKYRCKQAGELTE